ncbi:MAG: DUF488 family protein [Acidimicrobiaceae bacterium]|nr:DUF488 family protein [Acidimicrobiaceae bacterium]
MNERVVILRAYEVTGRQPDEYRVLIDRLWPRGRTRDSLDFDEWAKDVAPSAELRRWYAHDVARFAEFAQRYCDEMALAPGAAIVARLQKLSKSRRLVLFTATRDVEHSSAEVLRHAIVSAT